MDRACRSTRTQRAQAEAHQNLVIADLIESGHHGVAGRLCRCQHDRQHRQVGRYPWRCRSPGCWACRRTLVLRWWQTFGGWLAGPEISLAIIPLSTNPISTTKKLGKALRDVRDRAARRDHRWGAIAMGGLVDGSRMLLRVRHPGINRAALWSVLERRWPAVVLTDPGAAEPAWVMTVADAAALARRRRGLEPIRIVMPPQVAAAAASQHGWGEPMPMLF